MKERDIGQKNKKLNMQSFLRFSGISLRIDKHLSSIRCSESCRTLSKLETIISAEAITKRWRGKGLKSTASLILSKANTTHGNMNYFLKNTVDTSRLSISMLCWIKKGLLRTKMLKKDAKAGSSTIRQGLPTKITKCRATRTTLKWVKLKTRTLFMKY